MEKNTTYDITFSDNCELDAVVLLEVDNNMYDDLMKRQELMDSGDTNVQPYTIRGRDNDNAVLCTNSETYRIQLVEISNTQLLIPLSSKEPTSSSSNTNSPEKKMKLNNDDKDNNHNNNTNLYINGSVSRYYELVRIQPLVHRLRELLSLTEYAGEDDETDVSKDDLYSTAMLRSIVQASDDELFAELKHLKAIELNGYWRCLSNAYYMDIVERILDVAAEKEMPYYKVALDVCIDVLKGHNYGPCVIKHVLGTISKDVDDDDSNYKLNEDEICRLKAVQLLTNAGSNGIIEDEFMAQWNDSVPYGMITNVETLRGHAICIERVINKVWVAVPALMLPHNPRERFRCLFDIQAQWKLHDLQPYVYDLVPPNVSIDAYLLKHCRAISIDNEDVYISK